MSWAEALAIFNFITWFLPIAFRSYLAWRLRKKPISLTSEEEALISSSIKGKNFKMDFDS